MNRSALNILSGSVSLAVLVLAASPAHALIPPEIRSDSGSGVNAQVTNPFLSQEESPQPAQAIDARIKQLAQATFGCTCMNCMNSVRQMIQQGQLAL